MIPEFLDAIWGPLPPGGFGEIRTIDDGVVEQRFFDDSFSASEYALSQEWSNVFFGVLPRLRAGGKATDVGETTRVLWADVDAKKVSDVLAVGKGLALSAVNSFPIPPQILVDSGGGYHGYWRLERDVPHALAVPAMRWIATALNGDNVHDKPRVLRLPGTTNWKRTPAVGARLLRFDLTRRYRFSDFEALIPVERDRIKFTRALRAGEYRDLPEWLVDVINEGAPPGQRSETCFRVILWLLRFGRGPADIRRIFVESPNGIGEKYAEKSLYDADRWFDHTITAAMNAA